MCEPCSKKTEVKIDYDDDLFGIVAKFNRLLKSHGLKFIIDDGCYNGYELVGLVVTGGQDEPD
jgi:hypothetical protein